MNTKKWLISGFVIFMIVGSAWAKVDNAKSLDKLSFEGIQAPAEAYATLKAGDQAKEKNIMIAGGEEVYYCNDGTQCPRLVTGPGTVSWCVMWCQKGGHGF